MARKTIQPCRHCGNPIPIIEMSELPEGRQRASRPKYCSVACRLWAYVDVRGEDECWPFKGAKHWFGYGMLNVGNGKDGYVRTAHTVAWEVANGQPMPDGMLGCHRCDNPPCCNPKHIFPGTYQDNVDDCIAKGRFVKGEQTWNALLTEDDVRAIRADPRPNSVVAREYGVTPTAVWEVRQYRNWKHVE